MSGDTGALKQAREKLNRLLEDARSGAIIPVRLPGQIEEIAALLAHAEAEQQASQADATSPDLEAYIAEEAYFVGHAVHELRTPMTSIRGYSDMIGSMGELSDMQKQFVEVIRSNARRMESLLMDVSYANKIRSGTLKISTKMDMFKNIAMKVEKAMQPVADELNRKLEFEIPQGLPLLETDSELLGVALMKFVENGLRYAAEDSADGAQEDEGRVVVRAAAEGSTLVVTIEDNGIGMEQADLERLGEIYFRAENDTVRAYKGSGLGIPIAFGLLEQLDAAVDIQSEPGQGTCVTVRLAGMT